MDEPTPECAACSLKWISAPNAIRYHEMKRVGENLERRLNIAAAALDGIYHRINGLQNGRTSAERAILNTCIDAIAKIKERS